MTRVSDSVPPWTHSGQTRPEALAGKLTSRAGGRGPGDGLRQFKPLRRAVLDSGPAGAWCMATAGASRAADQ